MGGALARRAKKHNSNFKETIPKWATLKRSDLTIERERTLESLNSLEDNNCPDKNLLKTIGRDIIRINNLAEDAGRKLFSLKIPSNIRKDLKITLTNIFQAAELSMTVIGVIDSSFHLSPEQAVQVALCGSRPLQSNAQKKLVSALKTNGGGGGYQRSRNNFNANQNRRPKPRQNNTNGTVTCYNCQGEGHKANLCPTPKIPRAKPPTQ